MDTNMIIAIVSAAIGTGGISAILSTWINRSKVKADAKLTEVQANEYIQKQLKDLSDNHKKEADEYRAKNKELDDRLSALTDQINKLMSWIVTDNNTYRTWLENELRKFKPDIVFPKCKLPPGFDDVEEKE